MLLADPDFVVKSGVRFKLHDGAQIEATARGVPSHLARAPVELEEMNHLVSKGINQAAEGTLTAEIITGALCGILLPVNAPAACSLSGSNKKRDIARSMAGESG